MKKEILLFATLWLLANYAFSQRNYYDVYYPKEIYTEDFSNNMDRWYVASGDGQISKFEISEYSLSSYNDENAYIYYTPNFRNKIYQHKDFQIECILKIVHCKTEGYAAIEWGESTEHDSTFRFKIWDTQEFAISKYKDEWITMFSSEKRDFVNPLGTENKITIRKVDSMYYFFINENLVYECKFQPFFGQVIGLVASKHTSVHFTKLKMEYLEKSPSKSSWNDIHYFKKYETQYYKEYLFYSDFTTNKYNLPIGDNDECTTYAYGPFHYSLQSHCDKVFAGILLNKGFILDTSRNYEIEVSARLAWGNNDAINGFHWGCKDDKNYFGFGFGGEGYYIITKKVNNLSTDIVTWTQMYNIGKDKYNKLTLRKLYGNWYFFVNEYLVHSCPVEPFMGPDILIRSASKGMTWFREVSISYLN